MKRMIQMLVCCVLATVLVMGSMANAMAQSMVGEQFVLAPKQSQVLQLRLKKPFFTADFRSPMSGTTVVVDGGECKNQVTEVPVDQRTIQDYECGFFPSVRLTNTGNSPVLVRTKQ